MPTLPTRIFQREAAHQANPNSRRVTLSTTALSFLISLFVLFIFVPLCLVLFVRRRSTGIPAIRARHLFTRRSPAVRREDAKRELKEVTEIVCLDGVLDEKTKCEGVVEKEDVMDARSIFERECAICLSKLHTLSPPEPAKLTTEAGPVDDVAVRPPSVSSKSLPKTEEILCLNVCSHEFHTKCLMSWFVNGKYSCPVCRAVYYGKEKKGKAASSRARNVATQSEGARENTGRIEEF